MSGPLHVSDDAGSHDDDDANVVVEPEWGYRRLATRPDQPGIERFYESHYRDAFDGEGRAPDLSRLLNGGPDAERERAWLASTLHADVAAAIRPAVDDGAPQRVLDIGAGTGELVRFLGETGWSAVGVEPASALAAAARTSGLAIETCTAAEFVATWRSTDRRPFGAITLLNVLEHVLDPVILLRSLLELLAPRGRLVVRVPNDFSRLQEAARRATGRRRWWVAVPDHVNYFDHDSISKLLERLGLEVVERSADFPMELFLLMGDDYVADRSIGPVVHERRRRLELALDPELRRTLGRAWARAGVGRNSFVVARQP